MKLFGELKPGDRFTVSSLGGVYLRLKGTYLIADENDSGDEFMNAVNVLSGQLERFEDEIIVYN